MTVLTKVAVLLGLAASTVWGVPARSHSGETLLPRQLNGGNSSSSSACGVIAQESARQLAANPKGTLVHFSRSAPLRKHLTLVLTRHIICPVAPRFTAAQASACLQSVPNKPAEATKLVQSVKAFVSWQSTLAYLKDPPASYGLPAVDIMGGMDAIAANVSAGTFASEYDFQKSMVLLISQAHDGHFGYRPDVFKAFTFRNDLLADMVSVSMDGKQMPKLYNFGKLSRPSLLWTTLGGTENEVLTKRFLFI